MINSPDGLTGAVMAVESIPGASVLMHGPGGCRIRNALLSMSLVPREDRRWGEYSERYYAGYSRVPASYIDREDYIGGAVQKLEEALDRVRRDGSELIVVIDSPGASLMADNHMAAIRDIGVSDGVMLLDIETMSKGARHTYGRTLAQVVSHLATGEPEKRSGTILLLGLTVLDASWDDALDELRGYLEDMDLDVLCAPGAGASVKDLEDSVSAEFAAVVCPESCDGLAQLYSERGVKVIGPESGAPVGFDATRSWILGIAEATGADPGRALEMLARSEDRVDRKLEGMRYGMMRVRGMTFSASGPASMLGPLSSWLTDGLGMVPVSVFDEESPDYDGGRLLPTDVVFADGNTALRAESGGRCFVAVSTGGAVLGSDWIAPHPLFGATGAMTVLDAVIRASRGR